MAAPFPRRGPRAARASATLLILLLALLVPPVAAQGGDPVEVAPESTDQAIDPEATPAADRIEGRIREILGVTGSFAGLEVEVRGGVVFLRGVAHDAARKEWASTVARRVQGVVAVVNDLELEEPPWFTLEPAREALVGLARDTLRALPRWFAGLLVVALGVLAARAAARLAERLLAPRVRTEILRSTARRALALGAFALAVYVGLEVAGLTGLAVTVLGGTGLVGLAFGFAFRDIAENFLSGVLLSLQRPFRIGDTIEVDGHLGVVRRVSSHGTSLVDFDGNSIELSNTSVYKGAVRNFTANPSTRIEFVVGVGYDMPVREAQAVVLEALRGSDVVLDDPEPVALVAELGSASIQVRVFFWIDSTVHSLLRVRSRMLRRVLEALEAAGVPMPDEAREVVFPRGVPVRMLEGDESAAPAARAAPAAAEAAPAPSPAAEPGPDDPEGDLGAEGEDLRRRADASEGSAESQENLLAEPSAPGG